MNENQTVPTFQKLPSATSLFQKAWDVYVGNLTTILGVIGLPVVVVLGTGVVLGGVVFLTLPNVTVITTAFVVFVLMAVVAQSWGMLALLYAIKERGTGVGVIDLYRKSWPKILSYWWIALLAGFAFLGSVILFIIPGIIVSTWLVFSVYIFVAEDVKGVDALARSRAYVKGYWWRVFGHTIFISLVLFVLLFIVTNTVSLSGVEGVSEVVGALMRVFFVIPFTMIYMYLVYEFLRTTKTDLIYLPTKTEKAPFIIFSTLGVLALVAISLLVYFAIAILAPMIQSSRENTHFDLSDLSQLE